MLLRLHLDTPPCRVRVSSSPCARGDGSACRPAYPAGPSPHTTIASRPSPSDRCSPSQPLAVRVLRLPRRIPMRIVSKRDHLPGEKLLWRGAVLGLALAGRLAGAAWAQQATHVTGLVQDAGTKTPIVGVRVAVIGTQIGALTDAKGNYVLNVPPGRDSLSFRAIGYKPAVRGVAAVVNVAMEARPVELEAVVVTALGVE